MTVTNTNLRNDYTGNGSTTVYAFTFVAIYEVGSAKYSLKVITTDTDGVETLETQGTDYTVALASNGTGTVTFATAPTSGHKISILPDMTLTQETDYIKSGSDKFPAESHEKALDKLTLIAKQFFELFKRTIKLPSNSLLSEITIPVQSSNANKAIVVNSSGTGLDAQSLINIGTYPITAFAETLLDDTNASEARQTLGLVIGTNVQAYNAILGYLAGLIDTAGKVPTFTGSGMTLSDAVSPASLSDIRTGTDNIKVVTPKGLADSTLNSKTTNGYTYLPNGLILQWGTQINLAGNTSTAVNLPITFPNAFLAATVSSPNANTGAADGNALGATLTSTSQVSLINTDSSVQTGIYIAIGY